MPWHLTSHEKKALVFIAALTLGGAAMLGWRQLANPPKHPAAAQAQVRQRLVEKDLKFDAHPVRPALDLNRANERDLMRIPTVGHATAVRIIQYRLLNGPYRDISELIHVPGIGEKRLKEITPYVFVLQEPAVNSASRPASIPAQRPSY